MSNHIGEQIAAELREWYTPAEAELWLCTPNQLLNDERPVDLINEGRGGEVLRLIDQLNSGAYL